MAQRIQRFALRRGTRQHKTLLLIQQHGAMTAAALSSAGIYSPVAASGSWVGRVQGLLDRGMITVINTARMISVECVGSNDRPEQLTMTLTLAGILELRRLAAAEAPAPAIAPRQIAQPRAPLDLTPSRSPWDRPPVVRAGALDFAACPSLIGGARVSYTPTC